MSAFHFPFLTLVVIDLVLGNRISAAGKISPKRRIVAQTFFMVVQRAFDFSATFHASGTVRLAMDPIFGNPDVISVRSGQGGGRQGLGIGRPEGGLGHPDQQYPIELTVDPMKIFDVFPKLEIVKNIDGSHRGNGVGKNTSGQQGDG